MSDPSGPRDRPDRLIREALGQIVDEEGAQSRDAAAERQRQRARHRRNVALASILVPVCLVLTILNLAGIGFFGLGPPPRSPARVDADLQATVDLLVEGIEGYRAEYGRYPDRLPVLGQLPLDETPWSYVVEGPERYRLSLSHAGRTVRYDSGARRGAAGRPGEG